MYNINIGEEDNARSRLGVLRCSRNLPPIRIIYVAPCLTLYVTSSEIRYIEQLGLLRAHDGQVVLGMIGRLAFVAV